MALEAEVIDKLPGTYHAFGELNADCSEYVLRCSVATEPDLLRAGLIFGDAVHNLRSALDHALCSCVVASGGTPTYQHQFPAYTFDPMRREKTRNRWASMTAGIDERFMNVIREVQPYLADEPDRHALAVLTAYSNADKHRVLTPVALGVSEAMSERLKLDPIDLEITGSATLRQDIILGEGVEVLRFPVRKTGPDPHVDIYGHLAVSMAFGDDLTPATGFAMVGASVQGVVEALADLAVGK